MDQGTSEMLTKATVALVILVILIFLYLQTFGPVEDTNLISDKKERLDIIVSDNVPIGGFIPPTSSEAIYNELKNDNDFKDTYLKYGESGFGPIISPTLVEWKDIRAKIHNGIKLDGYCNDSERDTCLGLNEKATNFEADTPEPSDTTEKRNINFGTAGDIKLGSGMGSSQYSVQGGVPSVFVVAPNQAAKLSVYAGARITGNKTIEKISFGVYKGTSGLEENALTALIGEQKSCYFDKNFDCFKTGNDAKKCGCSEKIRYLEEPTLDLCLNFAELTKENNANFVNGCKEGEYLNCILSGRTKCEENFPGHQKAENLDVDDPCKSIKAAWKEGCSQYFLFENNTFSIQPSDYKIVKLGDVEINSNPDGTPYRGLAYVSAKVSVAEPSPGISCYSHKLFNDYETCCLESCKSKSGDQPGDNNRLDCAEGCTTVDPALEKCRGESTATTSSSPETNAGLETRETCAEKYCCSTTANLENDDRYLLCKNFCSSHDAFYGDENAEAQKNCTEGCDWAARMENQYGFGKFGSKAEVVFIEDMSGSMSDEREAVTAAIEQIMHTISEKDYTLTVSIYQIAESESKPDVKKSTPEGTLSSPMMLPCDFLPGAYCHSIERDPPDVENWGPAIEWVASNFIWNNEKSAHFIFAISDEGPVGGGRKDAGEFAETAIVDECYNSERDVNSVKSAMQKVKDKKIAAYALWGDGMPEEAKSLYQPMFKESGGESLDLKDEVSLTNLLKDVLVVSRGESFDKGYSKYIDLSLKDNQVAPDKGYYFRQAYDEVYSNLIYIVDWNKKSGPFEWRYPAEGSDLYAINLNENPNQPGEIRRKPVQPNFVGGAGNIISKVN